MSATTVDLVCAWIERYCVSTAKGERPVQLQPWQEELLRRHYDRSERP